MSGTGYKIVAGAEVVAMPGVLLAVLGILGLMLAATPSVAWAPIVSGVLAGITRLACCLFGAVHQLKVQQAPAARVEPEADQIA